VSISQNLVDSIDAIRLIVDDRLENQWKEAARSLNDPIKILYDVGTATASLAAGFGEEVASPYTDAFKKAAKEANSLADRVVAFPNTVADEFLSGIDGAAKALSEFASPGLVTPSQMNSNSSSDYREAMDAISSLGLIPPETITTYSQSDGDWKTLNEPWWYGFLPLPDGYDPPREPWKSPDPYDEKNWPKPPPKEPIDTSEFFENDKLENEKLAVPIQDDQDDEGLSEKLVDRSSMTTGETIGYASQFINFRSSAVEMMVRSGADFQKNAFDCFLVCTPRATSSTVGSPGSRPMDDFFEAFYKNNAVFGEDLSSTKPLGDAAAFAVRVQSINVPQAISETFEVPFLFSKVKKVRSKVTLQRKARLSIRMDEPLYFATFVNLASNNNNVALDFGTRPTLFAPFTTTNVFSDQLINKAIRADLYVSHTTLMRSAWRESVWNNHDQAAEAEFTRFVAGLPPDELPAWCFEDVNFLGMINEIEFDRDKASTMDGNFEFLFRRVYKMDFQRRGMSESRKNSSPFGAQGDAARQNGQAWFYERG